MGSVSMFRTAGTVINGPGALKSLSDQVGLLGTSRALIVTDEVILKLGLVEKVASILKECGHTCEVFDGVEAEPSFEVVARGVEVAKRTECDLIVGLGGGSAMDSAKGISAVVANGGQIADYVGVNRIPKPCVPTVMIPTTSGTGSEVTSIAIFSDLQQDLKVGVVSPRLYPAVAIVDPLLTLSVPPGVTALTGMDALTHAVEAYTSVNANAMTDAIALDAVRRITEYLPKAVADGSNVQARTEMATGSLMAGIAFANAGVAAVHALAYPLGARYHLAHGLCNTLLISYVMEYSLIASFEKYADLAAAMGENTESLTLREAALRAVERVRALASDIGVPQRLRDVGVKEVDLEPMAKAATKVTRLLANNPRKLSETDILNIYRAGY